MGTRASVSWFVQILPSIRQMLRVKRALEPELAANARQGSAMARIPAGDWLPDCSSGRLHDHYEGLATRSHAQYVEGKSLLDVVREDLIAERIAVESYNEIIRYLGDDDPTTRIAMEQILAKEEEHADDMKKLLETLSRDERFAYHS